MKKIVLVVACLLSFAFLHAQNVSVEVDILDSPIRKNTNNSDIKINFLSDFYVGLISPMKSPDEMKARHFGSWELGLDIFNARFFASSNHNLTLALNFGGRFFKNRHHKMISNTGGIFHMQDYPVGVETNRKKKSRLDVPTIGLAAGYRFVISDNFRIGFDVSENYNFGSRIVSKYKLDGHKKKIKKHGFKTENFTTEFRLTLGLCETDLYIKFAPHSLFKKEYGPKINYLAIGLIL